VLHLYRYLAGGSRAQSLACFYPLRIASVGTETLGSLDAQEPFPGAAY
jgi:hypothetical protein